MKRRTVFGMLAGLLVGMLLVWAGPASAQTVRAIMHAEVKHLDPHWTTAETAERDLRYSRTEEGEGQSLHDPGVLALAGWRLRAIAGNTSQSLGREFSSSETGRRAWNSRERTFLPGWKDSTPVSSATFWIASWAFGITCVS